MVEVQCICLFPARCREGVSEGAFAKALEVAATFAGNQVTQRFQIGKDQREIGLFHNDPTYGPGVAFLWRVPESIRADVVNATRSAWDEVLEDLRRHGISALVGDVR